MRLPRVKSTLKECTRLVEIGSVLQCTKLTPIYGIRDLYCAKHSRKEDKASQDHILHVDKTESKSSV